MAIAEYWLRIAHDDPRAVAMADRHYSRQSPGTPEFTRAGHKVVLLHFAPDGTPAALWASHRPAPDCGYTRMDGLDAWSCDLFRVEQRTVLASDLIREAVAITASVWRPIPADGFVTTINPKFVKPIKVRGIDTWGYCYLKSGWLFLRRTKARNLVMLQLPTVALQSLIPIEWRWDRPQFGNVRKRWDRPINELQERLL